MDQDKILALRKILTESDNIVFFGGAGVSTESGIPDFRSVDGLYNMKYKYPPEDYETAISTVISQCEMWTDNMDMEPASSSVVYNFEPSKLQKVAEEPIKYGKKQ